MRRVRLEKEPRVLFPQVPEPHMVPLRSSSGKDGLRLDGRFPRSGRFLRESVSGVPQALGAGVQLALRPASGKAVAASSRERRWRGWGRVERRTGKEPGVMRPD